MLHRLLFAIFLSCVPLVAIADWRIGPGSEIFIGTDSAFGVTSRGGALGIMCRNDMPFLWTQGWAPAAGGAERAEDFAIIVDGRSFAISGTHVPPDGLWFGPPPPALIEALKSGARAEIAAPSQPRVGVSLRGSSRALSTALTGCGKGSTQATAEEDGPINQLDPLIRTACGGGYTLADGAEQTARLDDDDTSDTILDWGGVSCDDKTKGRGAGFCGAALCTIEVLFTQTGDRQQILGIKPTVVDRAFGLSALQTTTQGATCGGTAQVCDVIWTWNGMKLEARK